MLAIWDDGVWQDALAVAVIILVAYLLVMWVAALVWVYRDIIARTRDKATHAISVLLVAVFNLPGLFIYLILRPKDTLADVYDRQLEAEALLHELHDQPLCPSCRRKVAEDFTTCPFCRTQLRVACESCGKGLAFGWVLCPYCGAERMMPTAATRTTQPPAPSAPAGDQPIASTRSDVARSRRRPSTATFTPPAPKPAPAAAPASDGAGEPGS
jgi:hypothetical protein